MVQKGLFVLYHNPDTRHLEVICANMGESPGVMTHNVFPNLREATTSNAHDDNGRYGHGDNVGAGTEERPSIQQRNFPIGGKYHNYDIVPGSYFRVGFRYRAFKPVEIPPPGGYAIVPFTDLVAGNAWGQAQPWQPTAANLSESALGKNDALARVMAIVKKGPIRMIEGNVEIVPVEDPHFPGQLSGWELWFNNTCPYQPSLGRTVGFIGTAVLTNAEGKGSKNAGLGLESMTCPAGDWSVMQFIEFEGDYGLREFGVSGLPGTNLRLGIRGFGTAIAKLPSLEDGPVKVDLKTFKEEASESKTEWFLTDELMPKVGEKKSYVDIYKGDVWMNDQLPDTIYRGDEAFVKAEFKDPPRVRVEWVDRHEKLPQGGWRVSVHSELPEADKLGPVGFKGCLRVGHDGAAFDDPMNLPARAFTDAVRDVEWLIPADRKLAGKVLQPGDTIFMDTSALGWRGEIALPARGQVVDTAASDKVLKATWVLRESDYKRAWLYPHVALHGAEAKKASLHPSPRLRVEVVEPSDEHPAGGWVVTMESTLAVEDAKGPLGFIATLTLGEAGRDVAQLPAKRFSNPGATNRWYLPNRVQVGVTEAVAGETLKVKALGLGWEATVALPRPGEVVDTARAPDLWSYDASEFKRGRLSPQFVGACRLGPESN